MPLASRRPVPPCAHSGRSAPPSLGMVRPSSRLARVALAGQLLTFRPPTHRQCQQELPPTRWQAGSGSSCPHRGLPVRRPPRRERDDANQSYLPKSVLLSGCNPSFCRTSSGLKNPDHTASFGISLSRVFMVATASLRLVVYNHSTRWIPGLRDW